MKENFSKLMENVKGNAIFLVEFLAVIVVLFLVAYVAELFKAKAQKTKREGMNVLKMCMIAMCSAIAVVLMIFEIPFPLAPSFYKLDFSELPVLIAAFAYGPVAGVMVEFIKIILKLLIKGTSTAFVGELANFAVGCSLVLPASIIYIFKKKKSFALIGCIVGTVCMTIFGTGFNAVYLLPKFAQLFHTELDYLIAAGTEINSHITDVFTFVFFAVAPLNLVKGTAVSVVTMLIYKPLSPVLKLGVQDRNRKKSELKNETTEKEEQ